MSTRYAFEAPDGSRVELECDERFLALVRGKLGLLCEERVTEEHVGSVFAQIVRGASEA